jgi:LmbE family N-acetylglucosaminyl deacetylase
MTISNTKKVAIIVAHPDDETLWAGGTIMSHPSWNCFIVCLCRGSDIDRAPRFCKTLKILNAQGVMGDLDDGPDQNPLDEKELENTIMQLLPSTHYDLIITHNSTGEYTKHLRHEEVNKAVVALWHNGKIKANELWTFAYEDGNKKYFPKAIQSATFFKILPIQIWLKKYKIITDTYGFKKGGWEAETTPRLEAFWQFKKVNFVQGSISSIENYIKISSFMIFKNLIRKR